MSVLNCVECGEAFPEEDLVLLKQEYVCAICKPVVLQKIDEEVDVISDDYCRPAGFWIRTGAYIIDGLILSPISIISILNIMYWKSLALMFFISVIGIAFRPVLHGILGATPGKMICKIWVRTEDGSAISMGQAWLRSAIFTFSGILGLISTYMIFSAEGFEEPFNFLEYSKFISANTNQVLYILTNIVGMIAFVALITVAFTHRKRGLHDMMGKTYCIHKEK